MAFRRSENRRSQDFAQLNIRNEETLSFIRHDQSPLKQEWRVYFQMVRSKRN
jgi:hypothetical protein